MSNEPIDPDDRIDPLTVPPLHRPLMPADKVIDLRTIRRARAKRSCQHRHSLIDHAARVVECADCGSALDPFDTLMDLVRNPEWLDAIRDERLVLSERMESLRKEHESLRAKVTAAKRGARKHDGETRTRYLIAALELLRDRSRSDRCDATYVAHLTTAVLKGHSLELADQVAGNASLISQRNEKSRKKIS